MGKKRSEGALREVLRQGISKSGVAIELLRERNHYRDAAIYYTILREGRACRYTPFLDRAEQLYELFMLDVTNASELGDPAAMRPMRSWAGKRKQDAIDSGA